MKPKKMTIYDICFGILIVAAITGGWDGINRIKSRKTETACERLPGDGDRVLTVADGNEPEYYVKAPDNLIFRETTDDITIVMPPVFDPNTYVIAPIYRKCPVIDYSLSGAGSVEIWVNDANCLEIRYKGCTPEQGAKILVAIVDETKWAVK